MNASSLRLPGAGHQCQVQAMHAEGLIDEKAFADKKNAFLDKF